MILLADVHAVVVHDNNVCNDASSLTKNSALLEWKDRLAREGDRGYEESPFLPVCADDDASNEEEDNAITCCSVLAAAVLDARAPPTAEEKDGPIPTFVLIPCCVESSNIFLKASSTPVHWVVKWVRAFVGLNFCSVFT